MKTNKVHTFIYLLLSIISSFSILVSLNKEGIVQLQHYTKTSSLSCFILGIALFFFYKKYLFIKKSKLSFIVLASLFSLIMTIGYSYDVVDDSYLVFGNLGFFLISIVKLIGYFIVFNLSLNIIYDYLITHKLKDNKIINKFNDVLNKQPFIFSFIFILICYLPYIISFYPAILNFDAANQIKEVMGIHTRYMDSVVLLNNNVTITNFNPVIHTLLLGNLFKFGNYIGNVNIGLFIYSIIQIVIVISVFAYSICYLKKEKVPNKLTVGVLLIYALVPVFPFYAMTTVKDVIFSALLLLYIIKIYDVIKNKQSLKKYIYFFIIMFLFTLLRNNAIYTVMLSFPFLLIFLKEQRKPLIIILLLNTVLYVSYVKVLLPALDVSDTSIREVLSIPFQQTARYVKYYEKDYNDDDKSKIDKILDYNTLALRYDHNLSDPVKNEFNKYTTIEDLKAYFGVWYKGLLKRPVVYFDATISNIYGYFYPNTSKWYIYAAYNPVMNEAGYDYNYNKLEGCRYILSTIGDSFPYIPIIGMFVNIGFMVWLYLFMLCVLIVNKRYKYIALLLPALSLILVCVACPANTYFRYALPFILSFPPTACLIYKELKKKN